MDCHAYVGSSVSSKEVEFANDGSVIPCFKSRWPVFVWVEDLVYWGFSGFAIGEASVSNDGINEARVYHVDASFGVSGDADA